MRLDRLNNRKVDWSFLQEVNIISGSHPSINPFSYEATTTLFPKDWVTGIFASYRYGHDDYNYRIVDSRNQFSIGVQWNFFKEKEIERDE